MFAVGLWLSATLPTLANNSLKGIQPAFFHIEPLEGDATKCGLDRQALRNAMKLPIRAYTKYQGNAYSRQ